MLPICLFHSSKRVWKFRSSSGPRKCAQINAVLKTQIATVVIIFLPRNYCVCWNFWRSKAPAWSSNSKNILFPTFAFLVIWYSLLKPVFTTFAIQRHRSTIIPFIWYSHECPFHLKIILHIFWYMRNYSLTIKNKFHI